jgi:hypothetical protein
VDAYITYGARICSTTNPPLNNCTNSGSYKNVYYCDGTLNPNINYSVNCFVNASKCNSTPPYTPPPSCSEVENENTFLSCGAGGAKLSTFPAGGTVDTRSAYWKTQGCCPAALL